MFRYMCDFGPGVVHGLLGTDKLRPQQSVWKLQQMSGIRRCPGIKNIGKLIKVEFIGEFF